MKSFPGILWLPGYTIGDIGVGPRFGQLIWPAMML